MTKLVEVEYNGSEYRETGVFTPAEEKNSTDILYRAAEVLGEAGWCQGQARNREGQFCAIGAIREAAVEIVGTRDSWSETLAIGRMSERVRKEVGSPLYSIPRWNDEEGRSAEDVILAMKRTASE